MLNVEYAFEEPIQDNTEALDLRPIAEIFIPTTTLEKHMTTRIINALKYYTKSKIASDLSRMKLEKFCKLPNVGPKCVDFAIKCWIEAGHKIQSDKESSMFII